MLYCKLGAKTVDRQRWMFGALGMVFVAGVSLAAESLRAQVPAGDDPPPWLVSALETKEADVQANIVGPCKATNENALAPERERETKCPACSEELAQFAVVERQVMARCDIRGIEARLADIDDRKKAALARLAQLVQQFQRQVKSNEVLCDEIAADESQAKAAFKEAAAGQILSTVLDMAPGQQIARIEAAETKLAEVKAVSRVRTGELGAFVAEMKAELAGKSKAEARAILAARLEDARQAAIALRLVYLTAEQSVGAGLTQRLEEKPDATGAMLDADYATLQTALQILKDRGAEGATKILKYDYVFALAPDAIKISGVFGNIYQLGQNVDGLSSLAAAADSQRKTAARELNYLVEIRQEVAATRNDAESAAGP